MSQRHYPRDGSPTLSLCGVIDSTRCTLTALVTAVTCPDCRAVLAVPTKPAPRRANGHPVSCLCPACVLTLLGAQVAPIAHPGRFVTDAAPNQVSNAG